MSTLTVELPPDLAARLEAASFAAPEEKARLVRLALENFLEERERGGNPGQLLDLCPFPDDPAFLDAMKAERDDNDNEAWRLGREGRAGSPRRARPWNWRAIS